MMQLLTTKETFISPIGIGALFFKDYGFNISSIGFPNGIDIIFGNEKSFSFYCLFFCKNIQK